MELSEENLNGKIFNKWKIIGFHEKKKNVKYFWCECLDCHSIKSICVSTIIQGKSKSCGCQSRKNVAYNINKKENEMWIENNIAYIKIVSPVDGLMICDVEDLPKLKNLYIRIRNNHGNQYAIATQDYSTKLIHRIIMNVIDPKIQIDHINGNGLDNRKSNLRICNNTDNNYNKKKPNRNNKSGYRGVSYDKSKNKWVGSINKGDISIKKRFDSPELAYEWYIEKNKELFGQYSGFN